MNVFDMATIKPTIDMMISIYNYNDKHSVRYRMTEKTFKHMNNVRELLKDKAQISFTIIGSEKEQSYELYSNYFSAEHNDTYYEFDQCGAEPCGYGNNHNQRTFFNMLTNKINMGMQKCMSKNPDIALWVGSNDFVSSNFFFQLVDFYKGDVPQSYGIDNYLTGNTPYCVFEYDSYTPRDITNDTDKLVIWCDAIQRYDGREKYKYCACLIGINKACYSAHPEMLTQWTFDEGETAERARRFGAQEMCSKDVIVLNPKLSCGDKKDITTFTLVNDLLQHGRIKYSEYPKYLQEAIVREYAYYNSL